MKTNTKNKFEEKTHEGAKAVRITPEQQLRRAVMATLLWEKQFYEDGVDITQRIADLVPKVAPEAVRDIAIAARNESKLRHMPLFIAKEMAKYPEHKQFVSYVLETVIQRADELAEFLALYWKDGKCPISAQVKKGLARAFTKFNEYQLAKYNRDNAIKLRDVLFMVHAKPKNKEQEALWKKLVADELAVPDTWEVSLSAGANKKETFERLMAERKLGALATLRNLRNMIGYGVSEDAIKSYLTSMPTERILPFRFISAAKYATRYEGQLEQAMFKCLEDSEKLKGKTVLILDLSGSMNSGISGKSDLTRLETAYALAMLVREVCEDVVIYGTAGNDWKRVHDTEIAPPRRGFALVDAMQKLTNKLGGGGIFLTQCMDYIYEKEHKADRVIVVTDEQDCDTKLNPAKANAFGDRNYLINVASYQNGIGYGDKWLHIDGWSESVVRYITEYEKMEGNN